MKNSAGNVRFHLIYLTVLTAESKQFGPNCLDHIESERKIKQQKIA